MTKGCCVPQCRNNAQRRKVEHFHWFPKNKDTKKKWIHALKLGRNPSDHMVVCSDHFKKSDYKLTNFGDKTILKPGSIPSEKLPETSLGKSRFVKVTTKRTTRNSLRAANAAIPVCSNEPHTTSDQDVSMKEVSKADDEQRCKPTTSDQDVSMNEVSTANDEQHSNELSAVVNSSTILSENVEPVDSDKFICDLCTAFNLNPTIPTKTTASQTPAREVRSIGTQTRLSMRCGYFKSSDNDLLYFTGLERERFDILYKMVEKFDPIEEDLLWSKQDALLVTLHKCRHNLDFKMMEFMFEVDRRLISKIFKEVIHKLYNVLKKIDIWNMSFTDSKSYRSILDCTEFFVVRAGDPNVHQLTFSNYKHHPTFKLLVSCDEKGAVNFISDAYVGGISDREIVVKSGFLEKLVKGDSILADRGFDISDLLEAKGVLVNIPPFLRGKEQFSNFEVMKTRVIANRRILIEQINGRAKKNMILVTPLQRNMWAYADKAIYVCFALVNFYKPIVL